jgi:hypothetical protein
VNAAASAAAARNRTGQLCGQQQQEGAEALWQGRWGMPPLMACPTSLLSSLPQFAVALMLDDGQVGGFNTLTRGRGAGGGEEGECVSLRNGLQQQPIVLLGCSTVDMCYNTIAVALSAVASVTPTCLICCPDIGSHAVSWLCLWLE